LYTNKLKLQCKYFHHATQLLASLDHITVLLLSRPFTANFVY